MFFVGTGFERIKAGRKVKPRLKMWNRKAKHFTFVGAGAWLSGIPEGLLAAPSIYTISISLKVCQEAFY